MKLKPMTVTWIDARWTEERWGIKDIEDQTCAIVMSTGLGIEFEDRVTMCWDYYPESDGQSESCRHIQTIPKCCIKEIKYYAETSSNTNITS